MNLSDNDLLDDKFKKTDIKVSTKNFKVKTNKISWAVTSMQSKSD